MSKAYEGVEFNQKTSAKVGNCIEPLLSLRPPVCVSKKTSYSYRTKAKHCTYEAHMELKFKNYLVAHFWSNRVKNIQLRAKFSFNRSETQLYRFIIYVCTYSELVLCNRRTNSENCSIIEINTNIVSEHNPFDISFLAQYTCASLQHSLSYSFR